MALKKRNHFLFAIWRDGGHIAKDTQQTMQTSSHVPMNTQRVPGNNQTPNNTVIAPVVSDVLSLSLSFIIKASLTGRCSVGAAQGGVCCCRRTRNCVIEGCAEHSAFSCLPPVSVLILEMFSVANKSVMWSYTRSICKWIALAHIASDGNQKQKTLSYERENGRPILSVIVWILSDGDVWGVLYVNWMPRCSAIWAAIRRRHMKQQGQIIPKL